MNNDLFLSALVIFLVGKTGAIMKKLAKSLLLQQTPKLIGRFIQLMFNGHSGVTIMSKN